MQKDWLSCFQTSAFLNLFISINKIDFRNWCWYNFSLTFFMWKYEILKEKLNSPLQAFTSHSYLNTLQCDFTSTPPLKLFQLSSSGSAPLIAPFTTHIFLFETAYPMKAIMPHPSRSLWNFVVIPSLLPSDRHESGPRVPNFWCVISSLLNVERTFGLLTTNRIHQGHRTCVSMCIWLHYTQ